MADWIQNVDKEMEKKGTVGAFTKQATDAGMSVQDFAKKVKDNPTDFSERTRERAQFALNMQQIANKKKMAKGGEVEGGAFDLSLRDKSAMYKYLDKGDFTEEKFMKMFGKNEPQTADIIYHWAESRGLNTPQSKRLHKASMKQMGYAKGGKTQGGKFADGGRVANYKNSVELYYNDGRKDSTSGVSTKHDKFLLVSENRLDEIKSKDNYYNGFWQYPNKDIPPVPVLVLQKNERSNDLYAVPLRNYEAKDIMEFGGNYVGEYFLGAIGLFDRRNLSGRDADDISSYNQGTPRYAKGGKTQGYNDKLDESLGNTKGKRSTKEQNYKDRRNESEAMEKKEGQRKYARVKTMDKNRRKRKTPMTLAKEIRKEGEKWVDAVKRASKMMKNK